MEALEKEDKFRLQERLSPGQEKTYLEGVLQIYGGRLNHEERLNTLSLEYQNYYTDNYFTGACTFHTLNPGVGSLVRWLRALCRNQTKEANFWLPQAQSYLYALISGLFYFIPVASNSRRRILADATPLASSKQVGAIMAIEMHYRWKLIPQVLQYIGDQALSTLDSELGKSLDLELRAEADGYHTTYDRLYRTHTCVQEWYQAVQMIYQSGLFGEQMEGPTLRYVRNLRKLRIDIAKEDFKNDLINQVNEIYQQYTEQRLGHFILDDYMQSEEG